jgi:3-methyladenine DNA glycosylase AlkD
MTTKKILLGTKAKSEKLTAKLFVSKLIALRSTAKSDTGKFFRDEGNTNKILGVRMGSIFSLAKQFTKMHPEEIGNLLGNEYYEVRMGAASIMDFQARDKKISSERRKELFDLYIKRHDRINNWDLVDRSAPHVVGGYLADKPRKILYKLAKSKSVWERRTAIVSTWFFIRQNDVDDTFKIAALLVNDKHDLINKAVGSWIREAGKRDKQRLLDFLDMHAASMPRITLRYAVEKLDRKVKDAYMKASVA